MKLKEWLFDNRKTVAEFGKMIGYHANYVSSVMSKRFKPGERFIFVVNKVTNGQVTEEDLI